MTLKEMFAALEEEGDEFLHFERIENPRHARPDLCAFLMLHDAVPGTENMVSDSAHDEFFLGVDLDALEAVATPDLIRDLYRCGIRLSDYDCLAKFT